MIVLRQLPSLRHAVRESLYRHSFAVNGLARRYLADSRPQKIKSRVFRFGVSGFLIDAAIGRKLNPVVAAVLGNIDASLPTLPTLFFLFLKLYHGFAFLRSIAFFARAMSWSVHN